MGSDSPTVSDFLGGVGNDFASSWQGRTTFRRDSRGFQDFFSGTGPAWLMRFLRGLEVPQANRIYRYRDQKKARLIGLQQFTTSGEQGLQRCP